MPLLALCKLNQLRGVLPVLLMVLIVEECFFKEFKNEHRWKMFSNLTTENQILIIAQGASGT
jgi:hypothetical protein